MQSSTYQWNSESPKSEAAFCIDGDTGPPGSLHEICHTYNDRYPWFAADYGKAYAIERVEIVNRYDCADCAKWTRNVEVRVSEDLPTSVSHKFSGGSLLGSYTGPATKGQDIITISGVDFCL